MEQLLHSPQGFILMFITFTVTLVTTKGMTQQASSFDSRFSKVNPGDGVTGNVEASYSSITLDECIVRLAEAHCSNLTICTDEVANPFPSSFTKKL